MRPRLAMSSLVRLDVDEGERDLES